ncbi:MAG: magnesium/cobalt transporter CorA [Dehalococcoidia bacterium]|nr:magnesium/cobalt transporter CorA [Dehalococcoidia bacterium]MDD5493232.1 magnesium/cobalt transporter CorA [Dehalococcoidia bacterium]
MNTKSAIPLSIIHYDKTNHTFKEIKSVEECRPYKDIAGVTWINIDTVADFSLLQSIGEIFGLHELTIQDIANTGHRVKQEDFGRYLLIMLKMLEFNTQNKSIDAEQLSIIIGANFVITFQETPGDFFGALRDEIAIADSVVRRMGSDYLACRIIDIIVDNYFGTVEKFGDEIEAKEDELVANPTRETLNSIQGIKKNMMQLRQYVWPAREILSDLGKKNSPLIRDETIAYFRDVYDRLFEVMDLIEATREMVSGLIDIYLSSMSNRTNEVMKVLTVVATIFIPLTFIVGLYGMNFKGMPELESPWGYPAVLLLMLAVAVTMLIYFRRKKWI